MTSQNNIIDTLQHSFPDIPLLDIHYLAMKFFGVTDELSSQGRPSFNLIDDDSLFHVTFRTSEQGTPYSVVEDTILFQGQELSFRSDFVERVPVTDGRYFYIRNSDFMTPSLEDAVVLNLNFQRKCSACDFCQYHLYTDQENVTEEEGFRRVLEGLPLQDLSGVDEIAIVTGAFPTRQRATDHVLSIADKAASLDFQGTLFYMGYQVSDDDHITSILERVTELGFKEFRLVYTVEMFADRHGHMKGRKPEKDAHAIAETLQRLKSLGVERLEYSYIPGLDSLDDFKKGAELLVDHALPHLCIFSPWKTGQRDEQASAEYLATGPAFLGEMRQFYEQLYGGPVIGNNLGNLWPFPLSRVSPRWVQEEIEGDLVGRRYWKNKIDPRGKVNL